MAGVISGCKADEGALVWIGLRTRHRGRVQSVDQCEVQAGIGLVGDHAAGRHPLREVTLITETDLSFIAEAMGHSPEPFVLRRNLLLRCDPSRLHIGHAYHIGAAILRLTGPCAPCRRMLDALGEPGFRAMRGHGGFTAQVIDGGPIRLGDRIAPRQLDLFD